MSLSSLDHLFVALLAFALPMYSVWDYKRLKRRLERGEPRARILFHGGIMLFEWALALAVVLIWIRAGRSAPALGLHGGTGAGFWTGLGLAAAGIAILVLQARASRRPGPTRDAVRKQAETYAAMLPHDARELRSFLSLSVTAGICEELVYRGYLIPYFVALAGLPAAVVLSSVVFALDHVYLGASGAVRAFIVGLLMAGLYLLTSSLWIPMLAHAAIDIVSGLTTHSILRERGDPSGFANP